MLRNKICSLQAYLSKIYVVNSQKTVPLNDLEVHQIKAPSIGQSSHGRAIETNSIWHKDKPSPN